MICLVRVSKKSNFLSVAIIFKLLAVPHEPASYKSNMIPRKHKIRNKFILCAYPSYKQPVYQFSSKLCFVHWFCVKE